MISDQRAVWLVPVEGNERVEPELLSRSPCPHVPRTILGITIPANPSLHEEQNDFPDFTPATTPVDESFRHDCRIDVLTMGTPGVRPHGQHRDVFGIRFRKTCIKTAMPLAKDDIGILVGNADVGKFNRHGALA